MVFSTWRKCEENTRATTERIENATGHGRGHLQRRSLKSYPLLHLNISLKP